MSDLPILNPIPRPRVLLWGTDRVTDLETRLVKIVPTVGVAEDISRKNLDEWDVVITDTNPVTVNTSTMSGISEHVFVDKRVCVVWLLHEEDVPWHGALELVYVGPDSERPRRLKAEKGHVCNELLDVTPPAAGDRLNRLTQSQLHDVALKREGGSHLAFAIPNQPDIFDWITPLGLLRTTHALAVIYKRDAAAETLILPDDVPDLLPWIEAALWRWHDLNPDAFPRLHDWREAPEWQTGDEQRIAAQIRSEIEQFLQARVAHEALVADLSAKLSAARDAGDLYERALLTEQGVLLADAVLQLLQDLGFDVRDMDNEKQSSDQRLEDFRVTDPAAPGWVAVVEVKGFSGGAKSNPMTRIGQFCERMALKEGRLPDRRWYIANQYRDTPPGQRAPILRAAKEDVELFTEAGGAIFDTLSLFKLHQLVESGDLGREDARRLMREATGIFDQQFG